MARRARCTRTIVPGYGYKGRDIDAGVANDLADDFGKNNRSKDGIGHDLFPLTVRGQEGYSFHLAARETYKDREVYRVDFGPAEKDGRRIWAGEALIDAEEYQPVLVTTHMAAHIPMAVRIVFGTNVRQVGFKVTYRKFEEGLWFPVTFGGELQIRALFLYARTISIGAVNSDFRKTEVKSTIGFPVTAVK